MGEHEFNKRAKSKELKPVSEIVVVPVPPLIDRETFEAVQALFKGPTSHGDAIRRHQRADDAHRHAPLRQVWWRHDHPHRQRRALSVLRLLDESPAGPTACEGVAVPMD